jgi:lysyl-tRNA synthetase class 2
MENVQDAEKYYEARKGLELPYPNSYEADDYTVQELNEKYKYVKEGERKYDEIVSLMGRVFMKRRSGKKLHFYTVMVKGENIQIMSDIKSYKNEDEYKIVHKQIARGDIIGFYGYIARTKKGELSVVPKEIQILSPCLRLIPSLHYGINETENRYANRHLDLMINPSVRNIFNKRHKIINHIRNYLINKDFIEVETPMLSNQVGGATAKPFKTYHNNLKQEMYMRIAPELYLKQLVIGGMEKVFEIGKNFRNEGIDSTHNPEFTACEFYQAGADYYKLMNMTEELLKNMVKEINGSLKIEWLGKYLDFSTSFSRIDIMTKLQEEVKIRLLDNSYILPDLNSPDAVDEYLNLHNVLGITINKPFTLNRLLDNLIGELIEPKLIQPTFLMNHPLIMSPLAKPHRNDPELTERFELFVNGKELCNAYTELNNPVIQKDIFNKINKQKEQGDDEIPPADGTFVKAMEYGLPPTGGWGIGIDRLTMMLTNQDSIREVILFPTRKY